MSDMKSVLENRAKSYQKMLQDEGYAAKAPQWDDKSNTWDIVVKYEGINLLVMLDLDDPDFVRVLLPNFWDVAPDQLGPALVAADIANKTCKGAKVLLNPARNDTMATMDFLDDGDGIKANLLVRYLSMVAHAGKAYVSSFKEQESNA